GFGGSVRGSTARGRAFHHCRPQRGTFRPGTPQTCPRQKAPRQRMKRWWIYQRERFPLLAHGPLIAAFSACAVSYSSLLRNSPTPEAPMFLTAFVVCLLMFLQLRIADEFKDAED